MKYFIDPTELAVLKKLQLESKTDNLDRQYKGGELWRLRFGGQLKLLEYLRRIEKIDLIHLRDFKFDSRYIKLLENPVFLGSPGYSSFRQDPYFGFGKNLYTKIKKGIELDWNEVVDLNGKFGYKKGDDFYEYFTFKIDFPNKAKKLSMYLRDYLWSHVSGDLVDSGTVRYYMYSLQKQGLLKAIGRLAKIYGAKNLTFNRSDVWSEELPYNKDKHDIYLGQTRFLETVLALEQEELIKIEGIIREDCVRLSIVPALSIPAIDDWTRDFYEISSNMSYFNFIRNKTKELKDDMNQTINNLTWKNLSMNIRNGLTQYKRNSHKFRPTNPPYKVLKKLLESQGKPVTHAQFFKELKLPESDDEKSKKEFICQKVRDIRKGLKINRDKDPKDDVFYDTGSGFQLMEQA